MIHRAAQSWRIRSRTLDLSKRPLVMGILNVTPDSFSDGGHFFSVERAVEQALRMEAEGADLLDIGGESTRPYSDPVAIEQELERVMPVITELASRVKIPISIDTSKSVVAQQAVQAGAEIINDVTGLEGDPAMLQVARQSEAGICAMHMQGTPQTMQDNPTYQDVVGEILVYLQSRRDQLVLEGIDPSRVCLDPGLGFGKKHVHNLSLLREVAEFHQLGCPLLVGHSRKGFIAKELGDRERDRTAGTIGVTLALAAAGVQVLRVHDVRATVDALNLFRVSGGLRSTQWAANHEGAHS